MSTHESEHRAPIRDAWVLEPIMGKAIPVALGETLRIIQLQGEQCVDFNAFNIDDYKEHLSVPESRRQGFRLRQGDVLFSNPPRYRPMFEIVTMSEACVTDTLDARCHAAIYEEDFGFVDHPNCQDTLAESIAEYGLTPDDVHDSFNLWMTVNWNLAGDWWAGSNTAPKGDAVELLACFDTLCVPATCGSGDVSVVSNFSFKPIGVEVLEATEQSLSRVAELEDKYLRRARKTAQDFKVKSIRSERKLSPDPSYKPSFSHWPVEYHDVPFELDQATATKLGALDSEGGTHADLQNLVKRAFMMWYVTHYRKWRDRPRGSGPTD